ncbi:hypothetical protein HYW75_05680 [Candidatus Pacearchaeota archaeon]|nr:hypothetical protein [Candidatus Pacearchaeota archaeon]
MEITKKIIRGAAKSLIKFLEKRKIDSANNLDNIVGKSFPLKDSFPDTIEVSIRPSNDRTIAYTISYVSLINGVPLEVKINPELNYSRVIVKMKKSLTNYTVFSEDEFSNLRQSKLIKSSDIIEVRDELRYLSKI